MGRVQILAPAVTDLFEHDAPLVIAICDHKVYKRQIVCGLTLIISLSRILSRREENFDRTREATRSSWKIAKSIRLPGDLISRRSVNSDVRRLRSLRSERLDNMKCVSCGGTNLVEGTVPLTPKDDLKFNPTSRSFKDRVFMTGRKVHAYACLHCSHLQFAVDFESGDLETYQQFEGTQPTVLERLETPKE